MLNNWCHTNASREESARVRPHLFLGKRAFKFCFCKHSTAIIQSIRCDNEQQVRRSSASQRSQIRLNSSHVWYAIKNLIWTVNIRADTGKTESGCMCFDYISKAEEMKEGERQKYKATALITKTHSHILYLALSSLRCSPSDGKGGQSISLSLREEPRSLSISMLRCIDCFFSFFLKCLYTKTDHGMKPCNRL